MDDVRRGGRARRGRWLRPGRDGHLAQGAHRGFWGQLSGVDDRDAGEYMEGEEREGRR